VPESEAWLINDLKRDFDRPVESIADNLNEIYKDKKVS
jgi:hypothetical protein